MTNILHGQVFDENFLMTVATVGALCLNEYSEGVAVMLFYQVGEWFQSYAVNKSRRSISSLMDIRPDSANVIRSGGIEQVDPEEVQIGETIVVRAGERIPLDGTIIEGASSLRHIRPDRRISASRSRRWRRRHQRLHQSVRHAAGESFQNLR